MKRLFLLTAVLLLLTGVAAWGVHLIKERQREVFHLVLNAAEIISSAKEMQIDRYAPEQFKVAEELYESALDKWKHENSKWAVNRDFSEILLITSKIDEVIDSGILKSGQEKERLRSVYHSLQEDIVERVKRFETFYTYLPLPDTIRENFTRGRLLFAEAGIAREADDYIESYALINQASGLIKKGSDFGNTLLETYFQNFGEWTRLNKEALAESSRQPVIMVDKLARRLYVYENGKITLEFKTDLGPNWVGTKMREGDLTTPEGRYRVVRKRQGRHTIYYKALLINYPNELDHQRFQQNLRSGKIPRGSRIGGLIQFMVRAEGGLTGLKDA